MVLVFHLQNALTFLINSLGVRLLRAEIFQEWDLDFVMSNYWLRLTKVKFRWKVSWEKAVSLSSNYL